MKSSSKLFGNYKLQIILLALILFSWQKEINKQQPLQEELATTANQDQGHLQQTKTFSSEVAQKWQDMQLRILQLRTAANPYGLNSVRCCGTVMFSCKYQNLGIVLPST